VVGKKTFDARSGAGAKKNDTALGEHSSVRIQTKPALKTKNGLSRKEPRASKLLTAQKGVPTDRLKQGGHELKQGCSGTDGNARRKGESGKGKGKSSQGLGGSPNWSGRQKDQSTNAACRGGYSGVL